VFKRACWRFGSADEAAVVAATSSAVTVTGGGGGDPFYRRLWWGDDLDSLLGLPILCLGRCCSIPVLACFRIRPSCQRMLTLWHRDMEVVYRAIIRPAELRSAKRVARHAEGVYALDAL
jgi:hypothetical protein